MSSSEDNNKKENNININDNSNNVEEKQYKKEIEEKENNNNIMNLSIAMKDPKNYDEVKNIISAFFNYQIDSLKDISRIERDYKLIGEKYAKRLSFNYTERIEKLKQGVLQNFTFLLKIASPFRYLFKTYKDSSGEIYLEPLKVQVKHIISVRSNLRLLVRDWSIEGMEERNETYKPILN